MQPLHLDESLVKHQRRLMHWAADATVLVVLFGAMFSAWALVVVAALMLLGLLAYALLTSDPARWWLAKRGLIAVLVGGAVGGGISLMR